MTVTTLRRKVVIEQSDEPNDFIVECYERQSFSNRGLHNPGRWRLVRDPRWLDAKAAVADAMRFLEGRD